MHVSCDLDWFTLRYHGSKAANVQLWEDDGFLDQYLDDSLISSELEDEAPDPNNPLRKIPGHRQHVLQFLL